MELIIGLVVMALAAAAMIAGVWVAVRALRRKRPAPGSTGERVAVGALRLRLEELRARGFVVEAGGTKIVVKIPLLEAGSAVGRHREAYRIVITLDEAAGRAHISERYTSVERGVGGAGLATWFSWKATTAGARDREEAGGAVAPGGDGGAFRLDSGHARSLVEQAVAEAGWRVG